MYAKQEKEAALRLYDEIKSVSAVVQRLEYPSRQELYRWIYERNTKKRRKEKGEYKNTKEHPVHPTAEVKPETLRRCFEKGESIESVSQEIGYSRQSIYVRRITVAPPHVLERDFHANRPNGKWLTDITELVIPAGKVYVVSYTRLL